MAMRHNQPMLILALLLILGGSAMAGGKHENDADRCVAGKLRAIGDALSCRLDEEARQIRHRKSPHFARCDHRFKKKIEKLNARFRDACPYLDDLPDLSDQNEAIVHQVYDAIEDGDYDLSVDWPPNPCVTPGGPGGNTNERISSPSNWGTGPYSAQCSVMLYRASKGFCGPEAHPEKRSWMIPGVKGLAYELANGCPKHDADCQGFFKYPQPTTKGDPDSPTLEKREEFLDNLFTEDHPANNAARVIQRHFWNAREEPFGALGDPKTTAKSLGVTTDFGTYVGVYNCETEEQKNNITGCGFLKPPKKLIKNTNLKPFFVGAMVRPAETVEYSRLDRSNEESSYPRLSPGNATGKDCNQNDRSGEEPTKSCNFNVFKPKDLPNPHPPTWDDFEWASTISRNGFLGHGSDEQNRVEHPFAPCDRGWYQYALLQDERARYGDHLEAAKPVFKSVYQNFVTNFPIYGYVLRYTAEGSEFSACCGQGPELEAADCREKQGRKEAGVVLALEYVEDAKVVADWDNDSEWKSCQVECCVTQGRQIDSLCRLHNTQETPPTISGPGLTGDIDDECKAATDKNGENCLWQCGTPIEPMFPEGPPSVDPSTL